MVEKNKKKEKSVECNDKNCPIHGSLKTRGRVFVGLVVSSKSHKTVLVQWEKTIYIPKYERKLKKLSKVAAHNPDCINAVEGDIVKIQECRPLSKIKAFSVIEKIGKNIFFEELKELKEEGKFRKPKKELENLTKKEEQTQEVGEQAQVETNNLDKEDNE